MHIPNGFLTDPVCAASTLASAAALGVGIARLRHQQDPRATELMAATGAGIFAAQMVNFPIAEGTSAHVIGAALAAIALGPARGMLTMATVLAVQCLLFGDGGQSALGANILNMAVAGTLVAWMLYAYTTRRVAGTGGKLLGTALAALGSVLAASTLCSIELAISGTYGLADVLAAMTSMHAVIGICEAAISVAIVAAALALATHRSLSNRRILLGGLALAAAIAGVVAPWASTSPDGLERVAADLNFAHLAVPGWEFAIPLAGIVGVLVAFACTYTIGKTATVKIRKHDRATP